MSMLGKKGRGVHDTRWVGIGEMNVEGLCIADFALASDDAILNFYFILFFFKTDNHNITYKSGERKTNRLSVVPRNHLKEIKDIAKCVYVCQHQLATEWELRRAKGGKQQRVQKIK